MMLAFRARRVDLALVRRARSVEFLFKANSTLPNVQLNAYRALTLRCLPRSSSTADLLFNNVTPFRKFATVAKAQASTELGELNPATEPVGKSNANNKTHTGIGGVKLKDGTTYVGGLLKGEWHGQGKVTYPDGASYEGTFRKGQRHGQGIIRYPGDWSYEGEFKNSKKHGQGKLTYSDGRVLVGMYKEGMIWSGAGGLTLKEGGKYEGEFVEGKRHGQGELTYPDGRCLKGEYRKNQIWNGTGALLLHDGTFFEGEFKEGKFHGQGKFIYPDGRLLEGEFRNSKLWSGKGVLIRHTGIEYEGEFREGKLWSGVSRDTESLTETTWVAGRMILNPSDALHDGGAEKAHFTDEEGAIFEGVYLSETKKRGKGQIKYPDGSVFEGEWVNNKKHGAGRLTSAAGEVFEGVFVKGAPVSGRGVFILANGSKYEGELVQGKLHGLAKITNKEGVVEEIEYALGKKVKKEELLPHREFDIEGEWRNDAFHGTRVYPDGAQIEGVFKKGQVYTGAGVIKLKDGATYEGEVVNQKWHGYGKVTHPDGRTAEGEFHWGKLWNGAGLMVHGSDLYDGEVREGKRHGQGQIFYANGGSWQGEFREGTLWTGAGVLTLKDGAIYDGEFQNGFRHGQGKLHYPDGRTLEGEFNQSTIWNGIGVIRLPSGDTYEGEFQNGHRHGQGTFSFLDGRILTGEFRKGRIWNGTGADKMQLGNVSLYEGEFKEGKIWNGVAISRDGLEKAHFEEGQMVSVTSHLAQGNESDRDVHSTSPMSRSAHFTNKQGAVFEGVYLNENMNVGKGQIKYPDGSVYEGEWQNDRRDGAGRLTSAAGEVFEGVFKKDMPLNGKGVLPLKDGGKYEGELVQGKRHGLAKITNKEGVVEEVEFAHGKKVDNEPVPVPVGAKASIAVHAAADVVLRAEPYRKEWPKDRRLTAERPIRGTDMSKEASFAYEKKVQREEPSLASPAVTKNVLSMHVRGTDEDKRKEWKEKNHDAARPNHTNTDSVTTRPQSVRVKTKNTLSQVVQNAPKLAVKTSVTKTVPTVNAMSAAERIKAVMAKVDQAAAKAREKLNKTC